MRPKSNSRSGQRRSMSMDGMLPVNRAYRPGDTAPSLGQIGDVRTDGFHPQRTMREIGQKPAEEAISLDNFEAQSPDDGKQQIEVEAPKKSKRKSSSKLGFLKFWNWRKRGKDGQGKEPLGRKQKIRRGILVALLLAVLAGAGYFGFKFWQTGHNVFKGGGQSAGLSECKDISQLKKEGDCRINILLLGIGGPGHDGPDLTDTIMLASIDPINKSVALFSIPRDLWVQIPGYGSSKINAAYSYGKQYSASKNIDQQKRDGLKLLDQTLDPILGMTINYHVIVDFSAFKEAVNDLGGVTINVTSSELNYPYYSSSPTELYDPTIAWENNNNPIIARKGVQKMNGQQALLFARSRETSSDFARSQRQRALMEAIGQKVLSLGTFSNPVRISNLFNSFGQNVFTDMSVGNIKPLYDLASQIPSYNITSLDLVSSPGNMVKTSDIDGQSVVVPVAGVFNYSQILPYVRATLRDGYIAKENAAIEVYNATNTPGIATQEMSVLRSYGYKVVAAESTPNVTSPTQTTIVDLSNGANPYTRHYLENRFNTTIVTALPAQFGIKPKPGTSFVIILGQDASTTSTTSNTAG